MASTLGKILTSGNLDNFSNIKISDCTKSKLLSAMKDGKTPDQRQRDAKGKGSLEKLKQAVYSARHRSFVKCVEWARTCDAEKLSYTGAM